MTRILKNDFASSTSERWRRCAEAADWTNLSSFELTGLGAEREPDLKEIYLPISMIANMTQRSGEHK